MTEIYNNLEDTDPIMDDFVETQMDIIDRIHMLINSKFHGSQKELADAMGVSEANVSKMINGLQNYKLYTLIRLGHALGEKLIQVPCDENHESASVSFTIDRKFYEDKTHERVYEINHITQTIED